MALELISSGAVNVDDVITHRFALEDTESALTVSRRDGNSLKVIVTTSPSVGSAGSR